MGAVRCGAEQRRPDEGRRSPASPGWSSWGWTCSCSCCRGCFPAG